MTLEEFKQCDAEDLALDWKMAPRPQVLLDLEVEGYQITVRASLNYNLTVTDKNLGGSYDDSFRSAIEAILGTKQIVQDIEAGRRRSLPT